VRQYSLAPIAGYTDLPLRRQCRRYGLHFAHTALIDAGALVHGNRENDFILARGQDEPYLAVQLLGSRPDDLRKAAEMLDSRDFEAVDFNMGCPVRKILKRGAGAALMQTPEQACECLKIVRDAIRHKPLTVKTRILDESDPEPTVRFCQMLEACGIDGLTIHGRLPEKFYSGPVAVGIIKVVRENLKIPVTANGGIFSKADADALALATGCDRLMVARGALGNPWIFRELLQGQPAPPSHEEILEAVGSHVNEMVEFYGEQSGMILSRKLIQSYLCGRGYRHSLRAQATYLATVADFRAFLRDLAASPPVPEFVNALTLK